MIIRNRFSARILLDSFFRPLLQDIAGFDICREHGIIMAESPADAVLPPLAAPYRLYREYRYGRIKLTVYHRQGNEE